MKLASTLPLADRIGTQFTVLPKSMQWIKIKANRVTSHLKQLNRVNSARGLITPKL
jgi:hypothetical protein